MKSKMIWYISVLLGWSVFTLIIFKDVELSLLSLIWMCVLFILWEVVRLNSKRDDNN